MGAGTDALELQNGTWLVAEGARRSNFRGKGSISMSRISIRRGSQIRGLGLRSVFAESDFECWNCSLFLFRSAVCMVVGVPDRPDSVLLLFVVPVQKSNVPSIIQAHLSGKFHEGLIY